MMTKNQLRSLGPLKLKQMYRECNCNVSAMARALACDRHSLREVLQEFGIRPICTWDSAIPPQNFEILNAHREAIENKFSSYSGTVIIFADLHIPFHHNKCLKWAIDQIKGIKHEKLLVLGGDLVDLYIAS